MNGEDLIFTRNEIIMLADCQEEANCIPAATQVKQPGLKKKKGHTMPYMDVDYDNAKSEYLNSRIKDVYFDKHNKLQHQYGLIDDERPTTPKEYVERIIAGKYTFKDGMADKKSCYPYEQIRWRDPALKEDRESFEKALVLLYAAKTQAQDVVNVKDDPAERLKALQDFESATIQ